MSTEPSMRYVANYGQYVILADSSAETGDEFYRRMGRYFADPAIRKELGGPLSDGPDYVWLLVYHEGQIVAFSSYRFDAAKGVAWFNETYVFPEHRRRGLFGRLFELKYELCVEVGARVVKGLANAGSRPMFERHGWRVASVRGSWTYYDKEVEHVVAV